MSIPTPEMNDAKNNKRNYIRRKKYLTDCISQIKATLEFISLVRGEKVNPSDSQKQASDHAKAIEAVCWSPHSRLSADGYQKLMAAKTQELCRTILKKLLPTFDMSQFQKLSTLVPPDRTKVGQSAGLLPERAKTPQPSLPVPIIPQPAQHSFESPAYVPDPADSRAYFSTQFDLKVDNESRNEMEHSPFFSLDDDTGCYGAFRRWESTIGDADSLFSPSFRDM